MSSPLPLNQTITLSYASQAIYVLLSPCDMLFFGTGEWWWFDRFLRSWSSVWT